jgi:hypothetical protein
MRKVAQNKLFGDLLRLNAALMENADNLPQLELTRLQFDSLVGQMQETSSRQAAQAAVKQQTTRQLQILMTEASRLATILRLGVKAHYGIGAEKLVEFGLSPFRGRKTPAENSLQPVPPVPPIIE